MSIEELRASSANVLTVAQAVTALAALDGEKLDERTVRRACEDGQLPSIRVGRRILIPRLPLIALLEGSLPPLVMS